MAMTRQLGGSLKGAGRDPANPWQQMDLFLIILPVLIGLIGIVMVYSATRNGLKIEDSDQFFYAKRQLVYVFLGVSVMLGSLFVDFRTYRDHVAVIYAAVLGLLVLVLSPLGSTVNSAQSWIVLGPIQLQPAELAKLAMLLAIAAWFGTVEGALSNEHLVRGLVLGGLPIGLILLQPDLGSSLVLVVIVLGVVVVAGIQPRLLLALVLTAIMFVVGIFQTDFVAEYQRDRLSVFLQSDTANAGQGDAAFQLSESKTAIGAGGLAGAGLFNGSQTKLRFVPEQQTDFIFTVVGEEFGFIGSALLILLYSLLIWRIWLVAQGASDMFSTLLCTGVLVMLVFQIFENMGMTMGIMPITGIPLPFMSYGGSAMLTMFLAVGLVLNVHMRRYI
ncbi:MAG: rod shape-determining protein RodA [Acidimicrobiales bacterium]